MGKEIELKPCPACGGFDLRVGYNCVSDKHFVICCRCMMRGPENEGSKNNARKAWNSVAKREVADLAASDADCLKEMVRSLALKLAKTNDKKFVGAPSEDGWQHNYYKKKSDAVESWIIWAEMEAKR